MNYNDSFNCFNNDQVELSIDHIVTNNIEQALLLTNLFEEPSDLVNLGLDRLEDSNKSDDPNKHQFITPQNPSLDQSWWTIPFIAPIENQANPSQPVSILPIDPDSNHDGLGSKLNLEEPVRTFSGPDVLDPSLNQHLPLSSTGPSQSYLIESWIDFTGGGPVSNPTTDEQSPIQLIDTSPTELTKPSTQSNHSLAIDNHCSHLSSTPQQPTSTIQDGMVKTRAKKTSKRRISSVSTISSSSITSSSSTSTSPSRSSFSSCSISGGTRDEIDTNPRKTKTNKRNEFLERNRLAASRSRAKKKSYQRHLEEESRRLELEKIQLNQIIQDLITEKENLKVLVNQQQFKINQSNATM